jgi:PAS domain S-box-containing protein
MTETELLRQEIATLKFERNLHLEVNERFTTIFERSRLGNKIIDEDLSILQVNQSLVNMLGYDNKAEIIGTKILDYAPEERHKDWAYLQEKLWAHLTPSFSLETCLIKKDGSIVWCQVTSILIPDNGQTLGYTILEDITDKYYLRQQREEFISIASHELKTPITSLKATLQVINQIVKRKQDTPSELVTLSQNAERHVTKLVRLVEDLLNTTKIEQGQLALNKTWFPVSDVIDNCCSHIEIGKSFKIVHQGDLSLQVFADQQKIDQVLVNLVNNAVKYAPQSENIFIKVEHLGKATRISVTDQGNGIEEDKLSHVFDRFYRGKQKTGEISGLGLGLYISAEIIKRHGGEMGVESVFGEGATFWFTLLNYELVPPLPQVSVV